LKIYYVEARLLIQLFGIVPYIQGAPKK